ncbi:MAG: hypothetical protein L7F78_18985 [Syntrophales bacterium LBB04]|nr:hypothetical protein [Syntrophales bacterium LBB04]
MAGIIGTKVNDNGEFVPVIDESIPDPVPAVGIFYLIDNKVLFDAVPTAEGEPYGDAIQHGSHYDFWEALIPKTDFERQFKVRSYDAYPRGRVIFFPRKNVYRVYYDDKCICFSDDMPCILDCFGLDDVKIEFLNDEHYQCAGCNPHYLD